MLALIKSRPKGRFSDKFLSGCLRGLYWKESIFRAVGGGGGLKGVADREGVGMVEVALRWLVHHSAIDVDKGDGIIIGVSKLEQALGCQLECVRKGTAKPGVVGGCGENGEDCKC
jgi:aflatoxin B1 aldehyde reductase